LNEIFKNLIFYLCGKKRTRVPRDIGNLSKKYKITKIWSFRYDLVFNAIERGILIKRYTSDLRMECQDRHRLPSQFATRLPLSPWISTRKCHKCGYISHLRMRRR